MSNIAIIGAGISGLTTANLLNKSNNVTVFEQNGKPGGLIMCERIGGSLFHTCGGHVFNSKRKDVLDWFWSKFDRNQEFSKAKRNSVIIMGDRMISYPIEDHIYQLEEKKQKAIVKDILELYSSVQGVKPQNLENFFMQRFGTTLYELYFRPYNEKIWRRKLTEIPMTWLEGKMPMPTIEGLILNNFNHVEEEVFVHSSFWYPKNNGSQYIADRLAKGLNIRYNCKISEIKYANTKWYIGDECFDKVVFCGNVKDLPQIVKGVDINCHFGWIDSLKYHGTTSVFCKIQGSPYSWAYLPEKEYKSHRIICTGNFAISNNSPLIGKDYTTATIEFTDKVGLEEILASLESMPLAPSYITHKYNQYTYPIQDDLTRLRMKELKSYLSNYNFHLTGRFANWEYCNMDVAIGSAIDLCEKPITLS